MFKSNFAKISGNTVYVKTTKRVCRFGFSASASLTREEVLENVISELMEIASSCATQEEFDRKMDNACI